jgi:hypothetical protein
MRLDVQSEPQREYADHALGIQLRTHVALDVPLELISKLVAHAEQYPLASQVAQCASVPVAQHFVRHVPSMHWPSAPHAVPSVTFDVQLASTVPLPVM